MGSVGKLYPNMEAKIVDESGNEVAEDEVCNTESLMSATYRTLYNTI